MFEIKEQWKGVLIDTHSHRQKKTTTEAIDKRHDYNKVKDIVSKHFIIL
jgi:flavorubredoxin